MVTVAALADEAEHAADSTRLRELSEHRSARVRHAVAANPASDDDIVARLLRDEIEVVRLAAATNLAERPELQRVAADSPDRAVRAILAHIFRWRFDHFLPYDVQSKLAVDIDQECRARVAETTNYGDLFEMLLNDADPHVRGRCAGNPRITREQMETLVTDRAATVRAYPPKCGLLFPDEEQLIRLARDRSANVRWNVLFRVDRPREAIELIASDVDETNRRHAQSALLDTRRIIAAQAEDDVRDRRAQAVGVAPFRPAPLSPFIGNSVGT